MPELLVSVRSAEEARAAILGGASIIDVKEPDRGPLGRADARIWRDVVEAVGSARPVSVALGEITDELDALSPQDFERIAFRKVGLAHSGSDWRSSWRRLRERLGGPAWVAVVYADWDLAEAPSPEEILDEALHLEACAGILVDTWDKSRPSPIDLSWRPWFERARQAGRFTALAGSLDRESIHRFASLLEPDIIAVRGAACLHGDRRNAIDPDRVAALAHVLEVASVGERSRDRGIEGVSRFSRWVKVPG